MLPARARRGVSDMHGIISCHYRERNVPALRKQIRELSSVFEGNKQTNRYWQIRRFGVSDFSQHLFFPQMSEKYWV